MTTKSKASPDKIPTICPRSRKGRSSNRTYNPVTPTCIGKRTMSTSSKLVPIRTYLNPDKEKESIINENKGRTGIYR